MAETTPSSPLAQDAQAAPKQCRICFGEQDVLLGALISPCKCKGTMKYVHVECLNAWRTKSAKSSSFFQCDQCHYQYSLRRTKIAAYLDNVVYKVLVWMLDIQPDQDDWFEASPHPLHFDLGHFLYGTFSIAILSVIHLLIFWMPQGGFINMDYGWRRRGGGGGGGNGDGWNLIMIIILVVGTLRAFWLIYVKVNGYSKIWLEKLGAVIMEVHGDDD